jgi:CRP-like cAMP-binding protein
MIGGELGRQYHDGEVIFREGDPGDALFVIQFGAVAVTKATPGGQIQIATLQKGDILGEMALFDRQPRSASATAHGDARVLKVDKKKFFATISRDPTLAFQILQSLSRRVRKLNEELVQLRTAAAQPDRSS